MLWEYNRSTGGIEDILYPSIEPCIFIAVLEWVFSAQYLLSEFKECSIQYNKADYHAALNTRMRRACLARSCFMKSLRLAPDRSQA